MASRAGTKNGERNPVEGRQVWSTEFTQSLGDYSTFVSPLIGWFAVLSWLLLIGYALMSLMIPRESCGVAALFDKVCRRKLSPVDRILAKLWQN
jgi:hypothetical protein